MTTCAFRSPVRKRKQRCFGTTSGGVYRRATRRRRTSFKLPLGDITVLKANCSASVENEWLCLTLLRTMGLPVAESEIGRFPGPQGDVSALIVKRFDRQHTVTGGRPWIARLPQEDCCQVSGTPSSLKYEHDGGRASNGYSVYSRAARRPTLMPPSSSAHSWPSGYWPRGTVTPRISRSRCTLVGDTHSRRCTMCCQPGRSSDRGRRNGM